MKRRARRMALAVLCLFAAGGCAAPPTPSFPPPDATAPEPTAPPPSVSEELVLGFSVKGEPIEAYVFGNSAGARPTLVFAAIHGDEPSAAQVGRRLVDHLRGNPQALGGSGVVVIPVANPDAVLARARTNANGVDCNRNFPSKNWRPTRPGRNYTGPSPASEPETRAVMHAVATLRPRRVVSVHSPLRCNNYDGPPEAKALAELMSRYNGYPAEASIGYATPGSFGSWAGSDQDIPVVTLELPPRTPGDRAWAENRDALIAVIRAP